jgi:hypothetical protein
MKATQLQSAPFALSPSFIHPRILGKSESDEQRQFIAEEFEPIFKKFEKLISLIEKELFEQEEKNGFTPYTQSVGVALTEVEHMKLNSAKKARTRLQYALTKLSDNCIEKLFTEFCDNPNFSLASDFDFAA